MALSTLRRSRYLEIILHLAYWLFHFMSVNVEYSADWTDRPGRDGSVAPLSVVLFPVFFYLNAFWLIPRFLTGRRWYQYFGMSLGIVLLCEWLRSLIFVLIRGNTDDFFSRFLIEFNSPDNFIFGLPNTLFFAFLFSFAYRFTRDWITNQQLIHRLQSEKATMELNLLRSQVDPHFLFNNLNALDDLIGRDQQKARSYVQKLSSIYRYLIENINNDVVVLTDELVFIDRYIYLIGERFGDVYQLEKEVLIDNTDHYLIVPGALQTLVENVVKHNEGSPDRPMAIRLEIDSARIMVRNEKRLKRQVNGTGTGLGNLKARYQLLGFDSVHVRDHMRFEVTLPMIKALNN